MPYLLLISFLLLATIAHGSTDSFRIHTDYPYVKKEKLLLSVAYHADTAFKGDCSLQMFQYNNDQDSTLVLDSRLPQYSFKAGLKKIKLDYSKQDTNHFADRKFSEVLKRTGNMPPGFYKTFIIIVRHGTHTYSSTYLHNVDTLLGLNSPIRKDINKSLKKRSDLIQVKAPKVNPKANGAGLSFARSQRKVKKAVKRSGLTATPGERSGKSYVDLFYEDYFAGRYEVKNKGTLSGQVKQMEDMADDKNIRSSLSTDLGDPSLFSQCQKFNGSKKQNEELKGTVSLTTNMASGQDPYSGISNNYYEVKGTTELPIHGIPIEVEGLYTSQDQGREIKSSYVRVHYSSRKLKEELLRSISAYNTKVATQSSKSAAIEKVYGSAVSNLEAEKRKLEAGLNNATDVDVETSTNNRGKIRDLDKKIDRYKTLLAQYENTKYFDSSLVFAKTRDIPNAEDLSYKQLSKLGGDLLPDGKAKKFLSGITSMDAGMFPKNDSKYTMAGQMMKGASASYDLGFCETSATIGKTEFAGRTGNIDRYTCYSSKTSFRTVKDHKLGLIYYGYTADRQLYSRDVFFDKIDISAPGFFNTVHILSLDYAGSITRYVTFESEVASSYRSFDAKELAHLAGNEKMAYHFAADGSVPHTYLNMGIAYDKTGREFENSTLPMSLAGTEQYKATVKNEFFRSRLAVGVEFNKLVQNGLSSTASNIKWGFDAKTAFKKYPNVGVSYKPYTTFQSHTDTLAIPQRPMFGSVWVAKATYQFKNKVASWRFLAMYNQCQTVVDTAAYGNSTTQANIIATTKKVTSTLGIGYMKVTGSNADTTQNTSGQTNFINLNIAYNLNATINLTAGGELGLAPFGLCRRAVNAGIAIRPKKLPFSFRLTSRSNTFRLTEQAPWRSIYSGCIDITYKFKASIKRT